jgi:hypothetical protein
VAACNSTPAITETLVTRLQQLQSGYQACNSTPAITETLVIRLQQLQRGYQALLPSRQFSFSFKRLETSSVPVPASKASFHSLFSLPLIFRYVADSSLAILTTLYLYFFFSYILRHSNVTLFAAPLCIQLSFLSLRFQFRLLSHHAYVSHYRTCNYRIQ